MNLVKKLGIVVVILFALSFFVNNEALAQAGCCNDGKTCSDPETDGSCKSGVAICDKSNEVANEGYNTDCFVPIKAPSEVKITDFGRLFSGAVSFLLLIAFILAFFYLILGGISWLTSGGDKANIETARNKIIAAIIGLIIVAATWALFQLVGGAIGFDIIGSGGFKLPTLF
ncbi:hypothetical protein HYT02_01145 [Candidatus Gottesmanbacteria bacterium]|nr:hypothetical protein [Candidatus Gottesmanbacteria bacterium]